MHLLLSPSASSSANKYELFAKTGTSDLVGVFDQQLLAPVWCVGLVQAAHVRADGRAVHRRQAPTTTAAADPAIPHSSTISLPTGVLRSRRRWLVGEALVPAQLLIQMGVALSSKKCGSLEMGNDLAPVGHARPH